MNFWDSMRNVITRLGTDRDKGASNRHYAIDLSDNDIYSAYSSSWLARQIVDVPAEDATKKWRVWGENEDDRSKIEGIEKRFRVAYKVKQCAIRARLYGGSAILIGAGSEDFSEPLLPDDVQLDGLEFLTLLDRHDLSPGEIETDPRSEFFGKPKNYSVNTVAAGQFVVHPTRLVILEGHRRPHRSAQGGRINQFTWGWSVLQSSIPAIRQYDSTMATLPTLVSEAKTDIVKIPGLTEKISDPRFEEALTKRLQVAKDLQGVQGIMAIDGKEEYATSTYTFSGFGDVIDRQMMNVAGASDIPATRLFGMSPGGLNATGESDLANYYDAVKSYQENEITPAMAVLDQVLVCAALGENRDDIAPEWRPIRQMTQKEQAEIMGKVATTVRELAGTQVFDDKSLADSVAAVMSEVGMKGLQFENVDPENVEI